MNWDDATITSIRKADAKGRLTGFSPGQVYVMKDAPSGFSIHRATFLTQEDVYRNTPEGATPSEESQNYLRSFGLDPAVVSTDGLNEEGYDEFVLDESGKRVVEYGAYRTVRKPWPKGFDWNEFAVLTAGAP